MKQDSNLYAASITKSFGKKKKLNKPTVDRPLKELPEVWFQN